MLLKTDTKTLPPAKPKETQKMPQKTCQSWCQVP